MCPASKWYRIIRGFPNPINASGSRSLIILDIARRFDADKNVNPIAYNIVY